MPKIARISRFWPRQLRRELRGARSRLLFFTACLAIGAAAVTAVAGLASAVERVVRAEARPLLAADIVLQGRQPLPDAWRPLVAALAAESAEVRELVTVLFAKQAAANSGARSQLVELKAVDPGYPFYGRLDLEPPGDLAPLLARRGAVVAPELLRRLRLRVGDTVAIGGVEFQLRGLLRSEQDRVAGAFSAGPRVFIALADLAATGLEGTGSRVTYRTLLRLPPPADAEAARQAARRLQSALADTPGIEVQSYPEGQPGLREGIRRAERFLGVVALLSLLLGGVGVAQTIVAWVAQRLDAIAILKCLGMRPREILALFLGQTLAFAALASLLGALLGVALQWAVPAFVGDWAPPEVIRAVRTIEPAAIGRGVAVGLAVALLFGLPPLLAALRVPALRVLRRDAEPLPPPRFLHLALAVAATIGVWSLASLQAGSWNLGARFCAVLVAVLLVLSGGAWLARHAVARWPRRFTTLPMRMGLAGLSRQSRGTTRAMIALGFGVALLVALWQIESLLTRQLTRPLPADAPSAFFIDIQPSQWPEVRETLLAAGGTNLQMVPVVMARLAALDGKPVRELAPPQAAGPGEEPEPRRRTDPGDQRSRRWALTREQRLTYLETLPAGNTIAAGALWRDARPEVSVEEEYARDLGLVLGSRVRFDVQGVPLELVVTSLRAVAWETFGINFFWVVEPGVLEAAPQWRLAASRLPDGGEQAVQDRLAERFPNVTMVRIREVLEKVAAVLHRVGAAVRFLGAFTVATGILILGGAVSATSARRGREAALLKTLGMTRWQVALSFAAEHASVGLVAAIVGCACGSAIAWAVLVHGMEVPYSLDWPGLALAASATLAMTIVAGLAASVSALRRRPLETLRQE